MSSREEIVERASAALNVLESYAAELRQSLGSTGKQSHWRY